MFVILLLSVIIVIIK